MSIWSEQGEKDGRSDAKSGRDSLTANPIANLAGGLLFGDSQVEYMNGYEKGYEGAKGKK